jgi:hypothetical protein
MVTLENPIRENAMKALSAEVGVAVCSGGVSILGRYVDGLPVIHSFCEISRLFTASALVNLAGNFLKTDTISRGVGAILKETGHLIINTPSGEILMWSGGAILLSSLLAGATTLAVEGIMLRRQKIKITY